MYAVRKSKNPSAAATPVLSTEEKAAQAFMREVDDALREERLNTFWARWKIWIIAGVVLLFAVALGATYYQQRSVAYVQEQADRWAAAIALPDGTEKDAALLAIRNNSTPAVQLLAAREQATLLAEQGEYLRASEMFVPLIERGDLPSELNFIAKYHRAVLLAEVDTVRAYAALAELDVPANPLQGMVLNMQAELALTAGNLSVALDLFERVLDNPFVAHTVKQRALQHVATIEARAQS